MELRELAQIIMNPVRQRIVQYLLTHPTGTSGEISRAMPDVPTASLYRHIKKLHEAGGIQVVEEKRVRGAIEKTYALVMEPIQEEPTRENMSAVFYQLLLSLQTSFLQYFQREEADAVKDMLMLQTATLMLSDEEYTQLLEKLGKVMEEYAAYEDKEGCKIRRLTLVSSPPEE